MICRDDISKWARKKFLASRALTTLAIGGASGAALDYLRSALASNSMDFGKVDWHQVGLNAAGGAILALLYHFKESPLDQTAPPPAPQSDSK